MMANPFFKDKQILLIDADDKRTNDRTWCFWETDAGAFEDIVYKQWQQIDFCSNSFSGRFDIAPYTYKMIRGKDLYTHVFDQVQQSPNIVFLQEKVNKVYSRHQTAIVETSSGTFTAAYVFNSIIFVPEDWRQSGSLLQHFKGWMIKTEQNTFNEKVATMMDFRLRPAEENTFVYVLPVSETQALVEYTVFSPALLESEMYTNGLKTYIAEFLQLDSYTIVEEEFGVIPMSTHSPSADLSPVVPIGTAGGQTKGSSGYTFQFIQKHSDAIVNALVKQKHPGKSNNLLYKRFKMYDDTLLHILFNRTLTAEAIFSNLFAQNKPQKIFKFLDNETTVAEELKIMTTVPSGIFLRAVVSQFLPRN